MPNQLVLPSAPDVGGGCGICSGVSAYNQQLPEDSLCNFTPANPITTPALVLPTAPQGLPTEPNPSAIPIMRAQFEPSFWNPPNQMGPVNPGPQPGVNPYTKPCTPQEYYPENTIPPTYKTPVFPGPQSNPSVDPCANKTGGYNWNNQGSQAQQLRLLQASGYPLNTPQNLYPNQPVLQYPETDNVPILQSGKYRSAVTPNDFCNMR